MQVDKAFLWAPLSEGISGRSQEVEVLVAEKKTRVRSLVSIRYELSSAD